MNTADPTYLKQAIEQLRRKGVRFLPGLTDKEVQVVESRWAFKFPPDWRTFLQIAMPDWVNWRSEKDADIRAMEKRFSWTMDTIVPGVEQSSFWMPEWGNRPENPQDVKAVVKSLIEAAPKLIPIYSHRFIPAEPHQIGNPIFSVYGIDTTYYGFDLADYLAHEFGIDRPEWTAKRPKKIDFWWDFDPIIEFKFGLNLDFEANRVYLLATTEMAINKYGSKPVNLSQVGIPDTYIRVLQEWLEKVRPLYNSRQKTIHWSEDLFQEFWGAVQTTCNQINHNANNEYFVHLQPTETLINSTMPFIKRKLGKHNK